jgi:exopolysaccharide biosynthesis polyprenyl glycosylphosphotransferase
VTSPSAGTSAEAAATADSLARGAELADASSATGDAWLDTIAGSHGRRDYLLRRALAAADAVGITLALLLGFWVTELRNVTDIVWLVPVLPGWICLFALYGLYSNDTKRIGKSALDDLPPLFHALVIGTLLMWVYFRAIDIHRLVSTEALVFGLGSLVLVLILRLAARRLLTRTMGPEQAIFVGEAPVTAPLVRKMRAHPEYALEPVGVISGDAETTLPLPWIGRLADLDLREVLTHKHAERLIVSLADVDERRMRSLLRTCGQLNVKVSVLTEHVEMMGPSLAVDDIEGVAVLGLNPLVLPRSSRLLKRSMDLCGATIGLLLSAPVMALIAAAVKLDSKGPILFRQRRVGRRGRVFSMLKFRTMSPDAESEAEQLLARSEDPNWLKLEQDPRVTRVGRFLRRTSLDELPQLWNVLIGQMSLVGPRPLIPREDERVTGLARTRLDLAPGLTGLWQVLGRTEIPFEEMVNIDYVYVSNWSLWTDIKLVLRTFPAVLGRRGAN